MLQHPLNSMLSIVLLLAAQIPVAMCRGDKVCLAANEFAGRYSAWTAVVNTANPYSIDAREPRTWSQVERTFKRLQRARRQP